MGKMIADEEGKAGDNSSKPSASHDKEGWRGKHSKTIGSLFTVEGFRIPCFPLSLQLLFTFSPIRVIGVNP
jgi:hypothetical protein